MVNGKMCPLPVVFQLLLTLFLSPYGSATTSVDGAFPVGTDDVLVIVLSQANSHHAHRARLFRKHLYHQLQEDEEVFLHFTHVKWPQSGAWTVLPLLENVYEEFGGSLKWVLLCEEDTRLAWRQLLQVIAKYDASKEQFISRGLYDQEPTIIHHFAFHSNVTDFLYPDFAAGVLLSMPLVKRLSLSNTKADFSIDAKHELAMAVWHNGAGIPLLDNPQFCTVQDHEDCVTNYHTKFPQCGAAILKKDLMVAVKTCKKYHADRMPIVKATWGPEAKHLTYYSDEEDPDIPTVNIGLPNTEKGHCAKTLAILEQSLHKMEKSSIQWLLVADDDTLISLYRLRKLLSCYDANEAVVLGERYGYGAASGHGYDYITGGGGMVFSHTALQQLLGSERCACGSPDSPDDMILGICFKQLGVPLVHSPLFHQARPADYAKGYLEHQIPISFHKHWNVDPLAVFKQYLQEVEPSHDEL